MVRWHHDKSLRRSGHVHNLFSDQLIRIWMRVKLNYDRIFIMIHHLLMKWAPGSRLTKTLDGIILRNHNSGNF